MKKMNQRNPNNHYCSKCAKRIFAVYPGGVGVCCFDFKKYAKKKLPHVVNPEAEASVKKAKRLHAAKRRRRFALLGLTTKGEKRKEVER